MAISLKYDSQSNVLQAAVAGTPTMDDLVESARELITGRNYPAEVNTLWDLSAMEFHMLDLDFATRVIEMRKVMVEHRAGAKIALLSNYALGKPILELYCILSAELAQPMKIFCNRDKAMKWLTT